MSRSTRNWAIAGVVVVVLIVAGLQVAVSMGDTTWGEIWGLALFALFSALAVAAYFLPTIIAGKRKHRSLGGIVALNVLLGWTFLGWIVALVWSLSSAQPQVVVQQFGAAPQYQVGDIVNGHRWNGQDWVPLS